MSITSVGTLGTGTSSTSSNNFSFTTSGALESGNEAILVVVTDNIGTTDGTGQNEHTGVTYNSVAMTKLGEYINANAAARGGVTVSLWKYRPSSTVSTGVTVSISLSGNATDKVCSMWEFTATNPLTLDATPASNPVTNQVDASNGFGSASFSSLSSTNRLYFRGLGKEANSTTTNTATTNFTNITAQRSRNNANAVLVRGEFRINTSTGETSNPTLAVSGDSAGIFVALVETSTTTKTLTGVSKIQNTTSQTLTGVSKIQNTTSQTLTGKSRVQKTVNSTITGVSNIYNSTVKSITGKASVLNTTTQTITGLSKIVFTSSKTLTGRAKIYKELSPANGNVAVNTDIELTSSINNAIWSSTPDGTFSAGSTSYKKNFQAPTTGIKNIIAQQSIWTEGNNPFSYTVLSNDDVVTTVSYNWDYIASGIYLQSVGDYVEIECPVNGVSGFAIGILGSNYVICSYACVSSNGDYYPAPSVVVGDILRFEIGSGGSILLKVNGSLYYTYTGVALDIAHNELFQFARVNSGAGNGWDIGVTLKAPVFGGSGIVGLRQEFGTVTVSQTRTQTQTGLSRLQKTVTQTQTGLSRLQKTTTQIQTGLSRLQKTTTQIQTGLSRLQKTSSSVITGISRIQKTVAQTQTGVSRLQKSVSSVITGISRIQKTVAQTQTGLARIQKSVSSVITGLTRIQTSVTQIQTGLSRLQKTVTQTQTGLSRVQITSSSAITGIARIKFAVTQTITGLARIQNTTSSSVTGVVRIQKTVTTIQNGLARITNSSSQTIEGKASIVFTTVTTQLGKSAIRNTSLQAITGVSNVKNTVIRLISGVATISNAVVKTISGLARIKQNISGWDGAYSSLPIDDSDLMYSYNSTDLENVELLDSNIVTLKDYGYLIHQFKVLGGNNTYSIKLTWKGYSTMSCVTNPCYLQIYNYTDNVWETIGTNNVTVANALIILNGSKTTDLEKYYNGSLYVLCRIYQNTSGV